jgi:hypothetical protein
VVTAALVVHLAVALAVLVLLVAPTGYLLLSGRVARARDLGLAIVLGLVVLAPLAVAEARLGWPPLSAPLAGLAGLAHLARTRRRWRGAGLAVALALGAAGVAFVVNAGDLRETADGLAVRAGFDVSDRLFYAAVGQELTRPAGWPLRNPTHAEAPLEFALLPSAIGVLLDRLGRAGTAATFLAVMPATAAFTGALAAFALMARITPRRSAQVLTAVLVMYGGDLSLLLPLPPNAPQRAAHFQVFHGFAAETLFYNTWMWGLPFLLATVALALDALRTRGRGALALVAVLTLGLAQAKPFAALVLAAGTTATAVQLRRPRAGRVAAAMALGGVLALGPTFAGTGTERGVPLRVQPLAVVLTSAAVNPALAAAARLPLPLSPILATALLLVGAAGVRLLGFVRRRRDLAGRLLASSIACGVLAALLLVGVPNEVDGVQFLTTALFLGWIPAGPVLAGLRPRALPMLLAVLAVAAPVRYAARKVVPAAGVDRLTLVVPRDELDACAYLRVRAGDGLALAVPPAARGATALAIAVECNTRLVALPARFPYHVDARRSERRVAELDELFTTGDPGRVDALLDATGAGRVWDVARSETLSGHPRLRVAHDAGGVRLLEARLPPGAPGP